MKRRRNKKATQIEFDAIIEQLKMLHPNCDFTSNGSVDNDIYIHTCVPAEYEEKQQLSLNLFFIINRFKNIGFGMEFK